MVGFFQVWRVLYIHMRLLTRKVIATYINYDLLVHHHQTFDRAVHICMSTTQGGGG